MPRVQWKYISNISMLEFGKHIPKMVGEVGSNMCMGCSALCDDRSREPRTRCAWAQVRNLTLLFGLGMRQAAVMMPKLKLKLMKNRWLRISVMIKYYLWIIVIIGLNFACDSESSTVHLPKLKRGNDF